MGGRYKTWESKTLCRTENIKKSDREQNFHRIFRYSGSVKLTDCGLKQDIWRRNHEYKRTYSD